MKWWDKYKLDALGEKLRNGGVDDLIGKLVCEVIYLYSFKIMDKKNCSFLSGSMKLSNGFMAIPSHVTGFPKEEYILVSDFEYNVSINVSKVYDFFSSF